MHNYGRLAYERPKSLLTRSIDSPTSQIEQNTEKSRVGTLIHYRAY
jgi:hypothetical protein